VRILLVSDLHYALPQFDWVVQQVPHQDLVVIAGDHLDIASVVPLDGQIAVLQALFARIDEPHKLVMSSGNHDLTAPDQDGEQSAPWLSGLADLGIGVDGDTLTLGDTVLTVCPWWDGPVGRERVAAQLTQDAALGGRPWIWTYHWPPAGSPTCWTGKSHYGDADLLAWIAAHGPDLVLTGHVHNPPFRPDGAWADRIGSTWVFNPGRQTGPVPAHIEIDLVARTASWHSLAGHEVQSLDEPPATERSSF
jgi:Icc-related predicted phosphoesterase